MDLFKEQSDNPKINAQRNLCGRTHYVDDDTLKFHHSRVMSARVVNRGLLFAITTSDSLDYQNTKRGFRYVVFDIFGTVIARVELEQAYRTNKQAVKAMWAALNAIDAHAHTLKAMEKARHAHEYELSVLRSTIDALKD